MSCYDFIKPCPICGKLAAYINGRTNTDVVLIRTKRKTTNVYHRDCIEKEWNPYKRGSENG